MDRSRSGYRSSPQFSRDNGLYFHLVISLSAIWFPMGFILDSCMRSVKRRLVLFSERAETVQNCEWGDNDSSHTMSGYYLRASTSDLMFNSVRHIGFVYHLLKLFSLLNYAGTKYAVYKDLFTSLL